MGAGDERHPTGTERVVSIELELATPENFDEEQYLLANPDVARHVQAGGNALHHFRRHGIHEGRKQVVLTTEARLQRRHERFARLSGVLEGQFRFGDAEGAFPVFFGNRSFDLSQYEAESANAGFGPFTAEMRANPDGTYLDVGCGRRSYKEPNCLYLEVYPSVSADVVMDPGCTYPIRSGSLDGIGCFAVLEHIPEPWVAAKEFARMLKPGGRVFIDWPFLQPVHGYPSHYYNATREGLRQMFSGDFTVVSLDTLTNQTPDHTVSWILRSLVEAGGDSPAMQTLLDMKVADLVKEPAGSPFWREIVEALPEKAVETLACGNSLVAQKR